VVAADGVAMAAPDDLVTILHLGNLHVERGRLDQAEHRFRAALELDARSGAALFGLGQVAPPSFMGHFTVFVLSCFIGYMVIWSVSPTLHTPLMSVTNAISSIIVLGALTQISSSSNLIYILAGIAVFITCINIVGGFSVTQRMLQMFRG